MALHFHRKEKLGKEEKPMKFEGEYIGGHPAYPEKKKTDVYVYHNRVEIEKLGIVILIRDIKHIANEDEEKIRKRRIVALGLIFLPLAILGAVWRKKFTYTVIEYRDPLGEQEIVIDFGKHMKEAQPYIYQQLLQERTPA
jgi:hypothetical protein